MATIGPKNKTRSAVSGGDPRDGVGSMQKGSMYGQKFNANPFSSGGNMEVKNPDTMTKGSNGPKKGNAPKPEAVSNGPNTSRGRT